MDANVPLYVACRNGAFALPDQVCKFLQPLLHDGFIYLREDEDVLTISTTRIAEGRRRVLRGYFRASMFRDAKKLAIVNYQQSLRVMAVT